MNDDTHSVPCRAHAARVLRDAATALEGTLGVDGFPQNPYEFRRWLRERATAIAEGSLPDSGGTP